MLGFGTGNILTTILAIIFWGAVIYALMRTFWAVWEIPERLSDIERRLGALSDDLRRIGAGETTEKERKEE